MKRRKKSGIDWNKCPRCGSPLKLHWRYGTVCRSPSCVYIADDSGPEDQTPRENGRHVVQLSDEN